MQPSVSTSLPVRFRIVPHPTSTPNGTRIERPDSSTLGHRRVVRDQAQEPLRRREEYQERTAGNPRQRGAIIAPPILGSKSIRAAGAAAFQLVRVDCALTPSV